MSTTDKRKTETPQQTAPTHARRIDCGGVKANAVGAHPGRTPNPRHVQEAGAGSGRGRPRR